MATKKKAKKNSKENLNIYLELNGSINIVEVKDGVKTSTPLDGDIVLHALLNFLQQSIKEALKKDDVLDSIASTVKKKNKKKVQ